MEEESNFLLSGGDSLKALRFCEDIVTVAGATSPQLLEVILDGTFSDILHHVSTAAGTPLAEDRRRPAEAPSAAPAKRARRRSTVADEAVTVVRRAGEVTDMKTRNVETNLSEEEDSGQHSEGDALDLSLSWSSDTGRCVDASPVLLVQHRTDQRSDESRTTAFIGSHSHRVQALDLGSGGLLWERVLGDRIEASAAVSRCGSLVVIGQSQHFLSRVSTTVMVFDPLWLSVHIRLRVVGSEDFLSASSQVATTAVCISCAQRPERRGGSLRRETP